MSRATNNTSWFPAPIILILVLAAAVRVAYLVAYSGSPVWEQLTVDNWYHHHWAQSLADGNLAGGDTYFRAPFYVYSLGFLYWLFGDSLWVGRLFGLAVGLGSVTLTYLIAARLAGRTAAVAAGLLHALYPMAIYFESELLLDPLYTLILEGAVLLLLAWRDSERISSLFLASFCLGVAAITRPVALALLPLFLIWPLLTGVVRPNRQRPRWRLAALVMLGVLLPIAPVAIRNYVVADDPVLISSQGGINLYLGNNDAADGMSAVMPEPFGHNWQMRQVRFVAERDLGRALKPGEVSSFWRDRALAWILEHPAKFGELTARKLALGFSNRKISNNRALGPHFASFAVLKYNPIGFAPVLALAWLGTFFLWRTKPSSRLLAGVILIQVVVIALFFFNSRFRLPEMPFYFVLAGAGVVWLIERWRIRTARNWALLGSAVLIGLASYLSPLGSTNERSVQALASRGLFLLQRGNLADARSYFERALLIDPNFPELDLNRGICLLRLGDGRAAETAFKTEIDKHPGRVKGYSNLASLYLVSGRSDEAAERAYQAISLAPYDEMSHRVLLRSLGAGTNTSIDSLYRAARKSMLDTDSNLWVLNEAAAQLVSRNAWESALTLLRVAETTSPPPIESDDEAFGPAFNHTPGLFDAERATTMYLIGYCRARLGDLDAAVHYTERALELDTLLVEAYINLAAGYYSQGRLSEADSVLKDATRRFPERDIPTSLPGQ
jgi:tetratricopeptide (TPR) repeat protein